MHHVSNPIAAAALERALVSAARTTPPSRPRTDSRTADKFVIRGSVELFAELESIGHHHFRSKNAEVVAGIMDSLTDHKRSLSLLLILKTHVGEPIASMVLSEVKDFDPYACVSHKKFVARFPVMVRDAIRDAGRAGMTDSDKPSTMNQWVLHALVRWINIQRQTYALLSAAMVKDRHLLGLDLAEITPA